MNLIVNTPEKEIQNDKNIEWPWLNFETLFDHGHNHLIIFIA
jgi:hypothetical protein